MVHHENLSIFVFISVISFSLLVSDHVQGVGTTTTSTTYIVRVQNHMKPSVFREAQHWYRATLGSLVVDDYNDSNPLLMHHVYKTVFHGFAATLTPQQAQQLSDKPEVVSVIPDRLRQLHTTRSPSFLGLYNSSSYYNDITKPGRLLKESGSASNVIIGFLDTGIDPDHPSFQDDPEELGPIPSRWKGECLGLGDSFTCNNKIIGARLFPVRIPSIDYARDTAGHGSDTTSIAADRSVGNASLLGHSSNITAVGVAPNARIAVYKVCWAMGCSDSNILAGFDSAVEDGVDVISISSGAAYDKTTYSSDAIAIGSFGAMEKGVLVIASAGNYGPSQRSVENFAPWMTTVSASTIDRQFPADLVLGDGQVINGASLYSGPPPTSLALVDGGTCWDHDTLSVVARDKIVVCDASGLHGTKGMAILNTRGKGVVMANEEGNGDTTQAEEYVIPGLNIDETTGDMVRAYIKDQGKNATATMVFRRTELGIKPAPVVASFSSRGPSPESYYILKPDLIAPGVNILAASTDRTFTVKSGTSISCPHVAGVAALLKGAHPDWSPAMIRSAMMTTAYTQDKFDMPILDENDHMEATPWAMGAGHVDPEKVVDPGLVYDISRDDYLDFLCASGYGTDGIRNITNNKTVFGCGEKPQTQPWDLNYPAIFVEFSASGDHQLLVVKRTVTHVGESQASYAVTVTNPGSGRISVTVDPQIMKFQGNGEKQSYDVKIEVVSAPDRGSNMEAGKIVWLDSDGRRKVVSPVVVA